MKGIKYLDYEQPRQLFLDTLIEFYDKLSDKEFWASIKRREIALEALTQDYMRTDHSDHKEDATSLQAAVEEYRRREAYMERRKDYGQEERRTKVGIFRRQREGGGTK